MIFDWLMCRPEVLNKLWSTSNASNYCRSLAMPYEMVYVKESAWYGIWDLSEKQELLIFQVQSHSQSIFKQRACKEGANASKRKTQNVFQKFLTLQPLYLWTNIWHTCSSKVERVSEKGVFQQKESWQLLNLLLFLLVQTSTPSLYHMVIKVTEFSLTNVIIHLSGLSVFLHKISTHTTPEWPAEFNGPGTMFSH